MLAAKHLPAQRPLQMKCVMSAVAANCLMVGVAMAGDYLEPCQITLADYEGRVESVSRSAMPGDVEFWVTVIPSFQPEWSVGVSSDNGRYVVTHVVFRSSLWSGSLVQSGPTSWTYDFSKTRVRTSAKTLRISPELHEALRSEWNKSIEAARPDQGIGLDGVTFRFQTPRRCASAWSPAAETGSGKLVDLVMALARLADSEDDVSRSASERSVLRKLKDLHTQ